MKTRIAKMRQDQVNAGRRERGSQETALTTPVGALREKKP
jgi:hypothetical protein